MNSSEDFELPEDLDLEVTQKLDSAANTEAEHGPVPQIVPPNRSSHVSRGAPRIRPSKTTKSRAGIGAPQNAKQPNSSMIYGVAAALAAVVLIVVFVSGNSNTKSVEKAKQINPPAIVAAPPDRSEPKEAVSRPNSSIATVDGKSSAPKIEPKVVTKKSADLVQDEEFTIKAIPGFTVTKKPADLFQDALTLFKADTVPQNAERGVLLLKQSAEAGHSDAEAFLGDCYHFGRHLEHDDKLAVKWYVKAADQGHAGARLSLALAYLKGQGVEKNEVKAFELAKLAAVQGNSGAKYIVALAYASGTGVAENKAEGARWMQDAANSGNPEAQKILAESKSAGAPTPSFRRPQPQQSAPTICAICRGTGEVPPQYTFDNAYRTERAAQIRQQQLNERNSSAEFAFTGNSGSFAAITPGWEIFVTADGNYGLRKALKLDTEYCSCDAGKALSAKIQAMCPKCSGRGKIMFQNVLGTSVEVPWDDQPNFGWRADTCPACNGTGKRTAVKPRTANSGEVKTAPRDESAEEKGRRVRMTDGSEFSAVGFESDNEGNKIFTLADGQKKVVRNKDIYWMKKQAVAPVK